MFQNLVSYFNTTPNYMLGYDQYEGLDIAGLTDDEVSHIMLLIDDLKAHHQKAE